MNKPDKKDIRQYYSMPKSPLTKEDSHKLHHLIALHLKNFALQVVHWERRGGTDTQDFLFAVVDPYDEAEGLVSTLELFGFIQQKKEQEKDTSANS